MANKRRPKLDPYLIHEGLDRTNMLAEVIDAQLLAHPGIKAVPKAAKLVQRAADLLDRAYQVLGNAAVYETSLQALRTKPR